MFEQYRQRQAAPADARLNLFPVMYLFVALIPFLLLSASSFSVSSIPGVAPEYVLVDAETAGDRVAVSLAIEPEAIDVSASGVGVSASDLKALEARFVIESGVEKAVQLHLRRIKSAYPRSDTLVVFSHGDLRFDRLVAMLDAARTLPQDGPDAAARPLFPKVVFARFGDKVRSRRLPLGADS